MKTWKKFIVAILTIAVFVAPAATFAQQNTQPKEVSIIFSHDMHSHMDTDKVVEDGKTTQYGGLGRVATLVKNIKETYPDSILVDSGDFSMGTVYQTIFATEASEVRMMGAMGYDAITFGNHEFDYGPDGLAGMLEAAADKGEQLPEILCANLDWDQSLAESQEPEKAQALKDAWDKYGVKDYMMIEKDGVNIALFGLMGMDAAYVAPNSGVIFTDPVAASKRVVKEIKENEKPDVIICLSHCGIWEDSDESEDEILASEVPEIDVIISAHTHTELQEAIMVGDTAIVAAGAYNMNLGHVVLEEQEDGSFAMKNYELIPVDGSIEEDEETLQALESFREQASSEYFEEFGYELTQVLATNDIEFDTVDDLYLEQGESNLGNIIADSYVYAVAQAEGKDGAPVDVTVVPSGVIRATFVKGDITVGDVFNVSSLGVGPDGVPGYPLVSVYITGKELKDAAEVDISVSELMSDARLYMSGLAYDYNTNRMILNRAVDVRLDLRNGEYEELEDDQLYRVVSDLFTADMLGIVKDESFGLLSISPKDEDGNPITNFDERIIYNGEQELKAWYALASYIDSFENDQVPEMYGELQNRKNDVTSWNPVQIIKQPNKVGWIVMAAGLVVILIVIGVIALIRKTIRKRRA